MADDLLREVLVCDICGRQGTVGFRAGSKPGADICTSRRACSRRQRKRKHAEAVAAERRKAT